MTNTWQQAEEMSKRFDAGGPWLRLQNDGDKAVVVFLGDCYPREVMFIDGKYVPATKELEAAGHKPTMRTAFNVALVDSKEVKVIEQGVMFFKDVVRVRDKYGLTGACFEIKRHGAPKDTKTHYSVMYERPLTPAEQKEFAALPLHDFDKLYQSGGKPDNHVATNSYDHKPEVLVDPRDATSLTHQLKAMPRDVVDRFLAHFGVQRIKDLPARQLQAARAFVEEASRPAQAPALSGEVDPFA